MATNEQECVMADEGKPSGGFWSTLPGILTGLAAVIAAITTAVVATRSNPTPTPQPVPAAYQAPEQTPAATPTANPVVTATGPMGALQPGTSYNQGDIYDRPASSAEECSTMCYNDNRCRAMTFIISQQRCWIKDKVTGDVGHSPDMVSALRQIQ
jgi:hypothetical protein